MEAAAYIRPLGATCKPITSESLMSLIARHCEANMAPRVNDVLAAAGIVAPVVGFLPFTRSSEAAALASIFGTSVSEIEHRMHGPARSEAGTDLVNYFGSPLERRHLHDRQRRVAVRSTAGAGIHRPEWALRALTFCPTTFEKLTSVCRDCGAALGWTRCYGLNKCDRCEAVLPEQGFVPDALIDDLAVLAELLDPDAARRTAALRTLPEPFCQWDLNSVFDAVCELGAASVTKVRDSVQTNRNLQSGALGFLGPEGLTEGIRFLRSFDERLSAHIARVYEEVGSTSFRGFGLLSRHFSPSARKRALSHLIHDRFPEAMIAVRVPVKRQSRRLYDAQKGGDVIRMVEARQLIGVSHRVLNRLVDRSPTFLAKSGSRGGTVFFSSPAVHDLRDALGSSITAAETARRLGIPIYMIASFIDAGLIQEPENGDVQILFGVAQRIRSSSVNRLASQIEKLECSHLEEGIQLRYAIADRINPCAWAQAIKLLLNGSIARTGGEPPGRRLADLHLRRRDCRILGTARSSGSLDGGASCVDAAIALGASGQFISAAVSAGLIDGEVRKSASSISLESLRIFQTEYVLPDEIAARANKKLHQVRWLTRNAGLSPVHTINRVSVWSRLEVEHSLLIQGPMPSSYSDR